MFFNFNEEKYVKKLSKAIVNAVGNDIIPQEILNEFLRASKVFVRVVNNSVAFFFYNENQPLNNSLYLVSDSGFKYDNFRITKSSLNKSNPSIDEMEKELDAKFYQFGKYEFDLYDDYNNFGILSLIELFEIKDMVSCYQEYNAEETLLQIIRNNKSINEDDQDRWSYEDLCDYYGCDEDDWPCG